MANSVLHEGWSNDQLATIARLSAYMSDRWARDGLTADQAATIQMPISALMGITGKGRPDVAMMSAERLANIASISAERRGNIVEIKWPKFPEFQGMVARERPESAPAPAPAPALQESAPADPADRGGREPSEGAMILARRLRAAVKRAYPKQVLPTDHGLRKWGQTLDLVIGVDGNSPEDVERLCVWLFTKNLEAEKPFKVLSARALRSKFGSAWDKMSRKVPVSQNGRAPVPAFIPEADDPDNPPATAEQRRAIIDGRG